MKEKVNLSLSRTSKLRLFIFFALVAVLIFILTMRVIAVNAESRLIIPETIQHERPAATAELVVKRNQIEKTQYEYIYMPLPVDYEIYDSEVPDTDAVFLAKTMYGEYRNAKNKEQCAAVAWNILNRVDNEYYPDTIEKVVTQPSQYAGYNECNPVDADLYDIALDVLYRWRIEKLGVGDVGRILPKEYLYFNGNGVVNIYRDSSGNKWAWGLPSPY